MTASIRHARALSERYAISVGYLFGHVAPQDDLGRTG
jgi:hypothetical protein